MNAEDFANPPLCCRLKTAYAVSSKVPGARGELGDNAESEVAEIAHRGFGGVVTTVSPKNYLTDPEQWQALRLGLEQLKQRKMTAWIGDDVGRPSGKAEGKVLALCPKGQASAVFECNCIVMGPRQCRLAIPQGEVLAAWALPWQGDHPVLDGALSLKTTGEHDEIHAAVPDGRWLVTAFVLRFIDGGTFAQDPLSGPAPYINILSPQVARAFLDITYETYHREVGDYFGDVVLGFHNDEIMLTTTAFPVDTPFPPFPAIPWEPGLTEIFNKRYGYDLLSSLPALFHDIGPSTARIRCDFYRLIGDTCRDAFFRPIADWCSKHGVELRTQPLAEESLVAQTAFNGSVFSYLESAHVPSGDLLSFTVEMFKTRDQCLPAGKLVSSAAHIMGRAQCISDFLDYYEQVAGRNTTVDQARAIIGWLMVQGVTNLISLCDWRRRSVDDWQHLNAYAGRLSTALTGGTHVADIAVLYPIATVWSHYIPSSRFMMLPPIGSPHRPKIWSESYAPEASLWEAPFRELIWCLLEHQRDLDIIDDDSLKGADVNDGQLCVADERFKALIIPPMDVIDQRSLEQARRFAEEGGLVIGFHPLPCRIAQQDEEQTARNAVTSLFGETKPLAGRYTTRKHGQGTAVVAADHNGLLKGLADLVPPDIAVAPACPTVFVLHRRSDGRDIYFLSNYAPDPVDLSVTMRATGSVEIWNPMDGTIRAVDNAERDRNDTRMDLSLDGSSGQLIVFS